MPVITYQVSPLVATAPQYARAKAVCVRFQIAPSTLWHWLKHSPGFPKPTKVGTRVTLFDLHALEAYFKARSV